MVELIPQRLQRITLLVLESPVGALEFVIVVCLTAHNLFWVPGHLAKL